MLLSLVLRESPFDRRRLDGNRPRKKVRLDLRRGRLAIKLRLLPWKQGELFTAVQTCYEAARDLLPDNGVITRAGLTKLRRTLKSLKRPNGIKSFESAPGYRVLKGKRS